jgi:hypothetical protein
VRTVVVGWAPEDADLAGALHLELAARAIASWPAGPEIVGRYASSELIARLEACDGLVVLATPAAPASSFILLQVRLARELSRGILVVTLGLDLRHEAVSAWLGLAESVAMRECADVPVAAAAIEEWTPPLPDLSPPVVRFGAARATLLRVASHGGRIGEAAVDGVDRGLLQRAALHLRAIGLIDFSGSLDDDRTTLITVG